MDDGSGFWWIGESSFHEFEDAIFGLGYEKDGEFFVTEIFLASAFEIGDDFLEIMEKHSGIGWV